MQRLQSKEQFNLDRQVLLDFILEDDSPDEFEIFFGWGGEGVQGWYLIMTDYPSFTTIFMGATFEDALTFAKQWEAELIADRDEDLGDDDVLLPGEEGGWS